MTLTVQQHQGLHGEGVVFAMASSAGLLVSRQSIDVDGVDWVIGYPGPLGRARHPKIEVQVKTWSQPVGDQDSWRYRMSTRQFNVLAGPGFNIRRYLVLVVVPPAASEYVVCDPGCVELRHAAYWVSLADQDVRPTDAEDARTVVVEVPRRNLLTPEALVALVAGHGLSEVSA